MVPSPAYVALYVLLWNVREESSLRHLPIEIPIVLGVDADQAEAWTRQLVAGLSASGFVELYKDPDGPAVGGQEAAAVINDPRTWSTTEGYEFCTVLTDAGEQLLDSLHDPPGLDWEGRLTYDPPD